MQNKKNIPLIVGLAIPVLMIIFVALSIYLPPLFSHPTYDFIYTNGDNYGGITYQVDNTNHVIEIPPVKVDSSFPPPVINYPQPQLYYYTAATGSSRKITLDEAKGFILNTNSTSPDGYTVTHGSSGGGFLFFDGNYDYNNFYLKGHGVTKKISYPDSNIYYYNFQFLGWVNK